MRILLTTILMLVCLVAYSATPSYSNFSSNQFAPSGTYTVTVKAKAEMTNTVFRGVGTPAAELHGGWLSTNDTTGSITVMSNASTVWSNGVAAGSVAITNAGGIMNLEGGPFGTVLQFRFNTSGAPAMVISNGMVGVGKANPTAAIDAVGVIKSSGGLTTSGLIDNTSDGVRIAQTKSFNWVGTGLDISAPDVFTIALRASARDQFKLVLGTNSTGMAASNYPALLIETNHVPGSTNLIYFTTAATNGASGCGIGLTAMYQDPTPYESSTNTLVYSRSNALYVSDPTAAPGSIIQQNASAFMTPSTITNLLNVTAGKTNGIFVITNGPLVYIWSDGFNIYSKTIAP